MRKIGRKKGRRNRTLFLAAAVIVCIGIGASVWWYGQDNQKSMSEEKKKEAEITIKEDGTAQVDVGEEVNEFLFEETE